MLLMSTLQCYLPFFMPMFPLLLLLCRPGSGESISAEEVCLRGVWRLLRPPAGRTYMQALTMLLVVAQPTTRVQFLWIQLPTRTSTMWEISAVVHLMCMPKWLRQCLQSVSLVIQSLYSVNPSLLRLRLQAMNQFLILGGLAVTDRPPHAMTDDSAENKCL